MTDAVIFWAFGCIPWLMSAAYLISDGTDDINRMAKEAQEAHRPDKADYWTKHGTKRRRRGARMILSTPFWPLIMAYLTVIGSVRGAKALYRMAELGSGDDAQEK